MMHNFPYTDLHELNLDWILEKFKKLEEKVNSIASETISITVDDDLSGTSTNPVQNKVIKNALDGKASGTVSRFDTVSAIATQAGKTFTAIDKVVTNSAGQVTSVNLKTIGLPSGGGGSVTVDSALSGTSTNPVQNKVIKNALDGKASTATATTTTAGLMSATDKSNLDTLYADYLSASTALG